MRLKVKGFAILFLGSVLSACAKNAPQSTKTLGEIDVSKNQLVVKFGGTSNEYKLGRSIDGYEVNCAKTKILIWGKPDKMNAANLQDSSMSILDLQSKSVKFTLHFDKSIFLQSL